MSTRQSDPKNPGKKAGRRRGRGGSGKQRPAGPSESAAPGGEREPGEAAPKRRSRPAASRAPRAKDTAPPPVSELSPASGAREIEEPPEDDDAPLEELGIGSRIVPHSTLSADDDALAPSSRPRAPGLDVGLPADVEAQIRALEARLDGMIRRAGGSDEEPPPPSIRDQMQSAAREVVERLGAPLPAPRLGEDDDAGVVDAVRELFSSDYYLRQWGRIGMRNRSEEVDEFGLDPTYEARLRPLFDFLYKRYFRVETTGVEHIPAEGRAVIVSNHSGTLPLDGVMLRTAVRLEHPAAREPRWLTEDFVYYLPFLGALLNRIGAVRACQENAERLLSRDRLIAVFPEGLKGIGKLYRERYRLQRFGRGGFIRLCLRTRAPLIPCAIVGAEETNPLLYRFEYLSRAVGLPYVPVTPTFPWLGPLGLIPAPTRWRIEFGEPIRFDDYGPAAADDHVLVGRLAERVRTTIQRMLDDRLRERRSVWLG
ncbi:MAG: 1-acyl-sn-glycerol-3-phosphate acyltransferase [Sorangiineae bacterium]|nr:1-acyl-sn-glycerol-3-phosphate acyltransferase [Polyangiaceae bacterium]MEB2324521.1 1-acyl-sn-glycerol-3-phosphate acyltransferase [Sorangiineae bacterium]